MKIMKLEGIQRRRREEERGQRKLRERQKRGERREKGGEWVKISLCFVLFYFDDGFRDFTPSF